MDTGITRLNRLACDDLTVGGVAMAKVPASADVAADPVSIAASGSGTVALTVAGALTTDQALVTVPAGLAAGLVIRNARVSAANTVTVELANITAAPIDAPSTTFRVTLIR